MPGPPVMSKLSNFTSVFRVQLGDEKTASSINGENSTQGPLNQNQPAASSSAGPPIRRSQPRAKSRPVVSCLLCRSRKQKCDRLLPCGTCSRRGDGALCRYGNEGGVSSVSQRATGTTSAPGGGPTRASSGGSFAGAPELPVDERGVSAYRRGLSTARDGLESLTAGAVAAGHAHGVRHEAQVRLQKLEEMVNRMITVPDPAESDAEALTKAAEERRKDINTRPFRLAFGDPEPGGSNTATDARYEWIMPIGVGGAQPSSTGRVASLIGEAPFVGATNWAAVLDSIRDIQSYLGEAPAGDGSDEHGDDVDGGEEDEGAEYGISDEDMEELSTDFEGIDASLQAQLPNPNLTSFNNGTISSISHSRSLVATTAASSGSGPPTTNASMPTSTRDLIVAPSLLENVEADGIFAAVAATPGLADSSPSNPPNTSAMAQNPRMPKHMAEAVSCLPSRQDCDRLLTVYFQSSYMTGPFVHMDEFQRAYSRFWRSGNPTSAHAASPLLWVSMLASVLNIGAMISGGRQQSWMAERARDASNITEGGPNISGSDRTGENHTGLGNKAAQEPNGESHNEDLILASRLRKLSTRCLLAGDYLSGRTLAIEALLLNAHVRLMQKRDHDATLWATFSVAVRLAQRMGYQQVDAPTGGAYSVGGKMLTPFEKEMRRRAWYFVESFDMLYSFQFGMPTMIHEDETSTDPPNNLRDDDFDENSAELPPSRPVTDYTPALYFSVKLNLIRLLRKVLRFAVWRSDKLKRNDGPANKATITKLADELKKSYETVPSRLRMPTHIRDCPFSDASHDIMHRIAIELINHKATCILFRESLSRDISRIEEDGGVDAYGFTAAETRAQRQVCLVSALRILDVHTEFEYETRPASTAASATAGSPPDDFEISKGGGTASRGAGRLAADRHMLSTLALHDFLLAATILCLDLIEEGRSKSSRTKSSNGPSPGAASAADSATEAGSATSTSTRGSHLPAYRPFLGGGEPSLEERAADRGAKLDALRRAYALWHEQRLTSRDAAHAARVLGAIVTKLSSESGGGAACLYGNNNASYTATLSDKTGDWGITAQLAHREQIVQEMRQQERAQRAETASQAEQTHRDEREQAATIASGGGVSTSMLNNIPLSFVNSQDLQHIADIPIQSAVYGQQPIQQQDDQQMHRLSAMTQPPPAHLNYAYEWAEPGPFGAALNDPMNVDWNMVDAFLLDRQLDTEVGGNVWSADLMGLEN
ncbi:c6 transcription factor [Ophiostoma piceae UAMH 11346]|uniref:C6 transcription factor n=1 Tax=Ophiostoma piceae (strain UAMH 11346) TaxID=1262450 RepID=S3CDE1_OPHP1|nr:c6 transcription factor [Ophiostoma piceae UAMH 11346]